MHVFVVQVLMETEVLIILMLFLSGVPGIQQRPAVPTTVTAVVRKKVCPGALPVRNRVAEEDGGGQGDPATKVAMRREKRSGGGGRTLSKAMRGMGKFATPESVIRREGVLPFQALVVPEGKTRRPLHPRVIRKGGEGEHSWNSFIFGRARTKCCGNAGVIGFEHVSIGTCRCEPWQERMGLRALHRGVGVDVVAL